MKKILTIAGSDCSGGAGIQADIKTISSHKMYAMSVITALTAQNTLGVVNIGHVDRTIIIDQLDAVFTDIFPDAIKIGMVSSRDTIMAICDRLKFYNCSNVVFDPVMVSTSGAKLLEDDTIDTIIENLLPLTTLITPNLYEAEILSNVKINSEEDMLLAIAKISEFYKGNILIKSGHLSESCNDMFYDGSEVYKIEGKRINNPNTHGTGCTLSSAIACNIASGQTILESVTNAKKYISKAIDKMLDIGSGRGPLNHFVMPVNNSLFDMLIMDNSIAWESYVNHEIKNKLIYEEIDMEKFKYYIKQDYIYITSFIKYVEKLYEETKNQTLLDILNSCGEEHILHQKYVSDFEDTLISKETSAYIDYFEQIFFTGSTSDKIVALAPCLVGYAEFCVNISKHNISRTNKYYDWVQSYNSSSYVEKVREYIKLVDSIGINEDFYKLSSIFKDVVNLEVKFFNQML